MEPRTIVRLNPEPLECRSVSYRAGGGMVTAIYRRWAPGDSGSGGRCRLCRECGAYDDACLMVVRGEVTPADAPSFSTARVPGFRWQRRGPVNGAVGPLVELLDGERHEPKDSA